jgi:hypothetical protein
MVATISEFVNLLYFNQEGQYFTPYGRPFGAFNMDLTKTITNKSDNTVGMLISLVALGNVVNPRISCDTGEQKGWYMKLNLTLQAEDELKINTVKNDKYITINGLDTYNGEPILSKLEWQGADWLQLETGKNTFSATTEGEATNSNMHFSLTYKGRYE